MKSSLLIVTGYSGAGKTSVIKALEDVGFFCVDNLPIPLVSSFFSYIREHQESYKRLALGIDVRGGNVDELVSVLPTLGFDSISIIFVTAPSAELLKRFQETRRRHPLATGVSLSDAIEQERQLLKPLIERADHVIDTGSCTIHQLRTLVREAFCAQGPVMVVNLMSFGFKYGVPQECNFVYDVRPLPNPHFIPALRAGTGRDAAVHEYLFAHEHVQDYWKRLSDFFYYTIEQAYTEGRFFIHVAVGCTGGRHRSVAFVEELAKRKIDKVLFLVHHRDIAKDNV